MPKMQLAMFVCLLPSHPIGYFFSSLRSNSSVQKLISHAPINGAYTELFAGLHSSITQENNGGWGKSMSHIRDECRYA